MTKHAVDKRSPSTGSRVQHFLRLSRAKRDTWHKSRPAAGSSRLVQFLRIARGRSV